MVEQLYSSEGAPTTASVNGASRAPKVSESRPGEFRVEAGVRVQFLPTVTTRHVRVEALYPERVGRAELLLTARSLIGGSLVRIEKAKKYLTEGESINADYEVTLLQGDLPELFCCNALSEGFAAVIVVLYHALKNRQGGPLSLDQLFAVQRCLTKFRDGIFLPYEQALDAIDELEAVGLKTDPPEAADLNSLLLDESGS